MKHLRDRTVAITAVSLVIYNDNDDDDDDDDDDNVDDNINILLTDRLTMLTCSRDDKLSIIDLRTDQIVKQYDADGFHVTCDWSRAVFRSVIKHFIISV